MSIQYFVGNKLVGLSSDTKPLTVIDGATFYESDTQKTFLKVSGVWVEVGGLSSWQAPVVTRSLASPPSNPIKGDRYIVSDTAGAYVSVYPPAHNDTYVKSLGLQGGSPDGGANVTNYEQYRATNPANSLIGAAEYNSWNRYEYTWRSDYVRLHIDLGTAQIVKNIYYENYHDTGANTGIGAKAFTFWGTNDADAFADLTYATDTNWTQIGGALQFDQHTASNVADPKNIVVSNTTAYRYYAVKISSNWSDAYGDSNGLRRIELQVSDTGSWTSHVNDIAICTVGGLSAEWSFVPKIEGMLAWILDEGKFYKFNGSNWTEEVGNAGISGYSGYSGQSGFSGEIGASGYSGLSGESGVNYPNDGSVNPTNILSNGSFEDWSNGNTEPPDNWTFYTSQPTGAVARDESKFQFGSYSAKLSSDTDGDTLIATNYELDIAYWQSRIVTFGCWVWCDVANSAVLGIYDQISGTESPRHTGSSTWEWLSLTYTIDASATRLDFYCNIYKAGSAYFDGAIVVDGSSQFSFADRPVFTPQLESRISTRVINDGSVNPTNLVANGSFELWTQGDSVVPDSWSLWEDTEITGTIAKESSTIKIGSYSAKLTKGTNDIFLNQDIASVKGIEYWKGRTVTFGAWVWSDEADDAELGITDGVGGWGIRHNGNSTWQWLTGTFTISPTATVVQAYFGAYGTNAVYFDGAMFVEGNSAFAYEDKPLSRNDIILKDGSVNPTNLIPNGSFENWDDLSTPTGWGGFFGTGTSEAETTIVKIGSTSLKIVSTGSEKGTGQSLMYGEKNLEYWQGRTITIGCWVWCDTPNQAAIGIWDGVAGNEKRHSGSSAWEWLTYTQVISPSATNVDVYVDIYGTNTAYFDGFMCVEGASSFAYQVKIEGVSGYSGYSGESGYSGSSEFSTWQAPILDKDLTEPPGLPEVGDRYLVLSLTDIAHSSQYPPEQNTTYVKVNENQGTPPSAGFYVTDPTKSLTGTRNSTSWMIWGQYGYELAQRFHIDLGAGKMVRRIYYENFHDSGGETDIGVQHFTLWGSNSATAFADLTYGNDTDWTQLTTAQDSFDQHIDSDEEDPKYIVVTNSTYYRYYAFKFADNYGDSYMTGSRIGIRRIELQIQVGNDWIGYEGGIVTCSVGGGTPEWNFTDKREGMIAWILDENLYYKYDGEDWTVEIGSAGVSGYSGYSGYSGDSGISGYSGVSGISGFSGTNYPNDGSIDIYARNLILPAVASRGIKIDLDTPDFGWKDLLGAVHDRTGGASGPTFAAYNGSLYSWRFPTASGVKEIFVEFHIPHDYVPGSHLYIHTHWSQTVIDTGGTAGVPGVVKWYFDIAYAKGYDRGAFSSVITTSVTQQGSTTQRGHMIAEVQLSATTPSGSQLDSDDIETDGLILVRCYRDSNDVADTLDQSPWLHFIDLHYQSTNMTTKNKNYPFF